MTKKIFEVVDKIENDKKSKKDKNQLASDLNSIALTSSNYNVNQTIFIWDPTSLQRGKKEFDLKWGERKWEDNWRRSSKSSTII